MSIIWSVSSDECEREKVEKKERKEVEKKERGRRKFNNTQSVIHVDWINFNPQFSSTLNGCQRKDLRYKLIKNFSIKKSFKKFQTWPLLWLSFGGKTLISFFSSSLPVNFLFLSPPVNFFLSLSISFSFSFFSILPQF